MFDSKEKKEFRPRQYLEILPSFRDIILTDMKDCLNEETAALFKRLQDLKFDLLKITDGDGNRAECLRVLSQFSLIDRMERTVDKALSVSVQDPNELETLLKGLTTSLRSDERGQEKTIAVFKKNPAFIYCRVVELTR